MITRLYAILSCDSDLFIAVEFPWYCVPIHLLLLLLVLGWSFFVAELRELNRGFICIPFFYLQLKQKEFELSTVRGEVDESSQQLKEQVKFAGTVPLAQ